MSIRSENDKHSCTDCVHVWYESPDDFMTRVMTELFDGDYEPEEDEE